MSRNHAVFLRGITGVPMQPLREALEGLGFSRVDSFGASGNLLFAANDLDDVFLDARIGETLGALAPRRALGDTLGD